MDSSIEKKSSNLWPKAQFFLWRFVQFLLFFLLPIFLLTLWPLDSHIKGLLIFLYILFVVGQWFFLGKEMDYMLKIYFPVYSSIDRFVYRIYLGMFFFFVCFNLQSLITREWSDYFFWMTWILLGVFYSWPTRGRIVQESQKSSYFSELKYLDGFEKTLLVLVLIMMMVSLPPLPGGESVEMIKSYYDPTERFGAVFWNFLNLTYHPFLKSLDLFEVCLGISFLFYWYESLPFDLLCSS